MALLEECNGLASDLLKRCNLANKRTPVSSDDAELTVSCKLIVVMLSPGRYRISKMSFTRTYDTANSLKVPGRDQRKQDYRTSFTLALTCQFRSVMACSRRTKREPFVAKAANETCLIHENSINPFYANKV